MGKNILIIMLAVIVSIVLFFTGVGVAFYGYSYRVMVNAQDNWPNLFCEIVPDKRWIAALMMFSAGMLTAIVPITLLFIKLGRIFKAIAQ